MINKYTKKELPMTGNIMLWYTKLWNINKNWASRLWKLYTITCQKISLGANIFQRTFWGSDIWRGIIFRGPYFRRKFVFQNFMLYLGLIVLVSLKLDWRINVQFPGWLRAVDIHQTNIGSTKLLYSYSFGFFISKRSTEIITWRKPKYNCIRSLKQSHIMQCARGN